MAKAQERQDDMGQDFVIHTSPDDHLYSGTFLASGFAVLI